jgi:ribosome-binding factor A
MSRGPRRLASRSPQSSSRRYPRTARVNEALRKVIAETLEEIDDDRLELVTITGVDTDPDLRHAHVYFSALNAPADAGVSLGAALALHRVRLQAAIGRQMQMKYTPQLDFRPDLSILEGYKIESIIATMPRSTEPDLDDGLGDGAANGERDGEATPT